jgi:hypothetical protein
MPQVLFTTAKKKKIFSFSLYFYLLSSIMSMNSLSLTAIATEPFEDSFFEVDHL